MEATKPKPKAEKKEEAPPAEEKKERKGPALRTTGARLAENRKISEANRAAGRAALRRERERKEKAAKESAEAIQRKRFEESDILSGAGAGAQQKAEPKEKQEVEEEVKEEGELRGEAKVAEPEAVEDEEEEDEEEEPLLPESRQPESPSVMSRLQSRLQTTIRRAVSSPGQLVERRLAELALSRLHTDTRRGPPLRRDPALARREQQERNADDLVADMNAGVQPGAYEENRRRAIERGEEWRGLTAEQRQRIRDDAREAMRNHEINMLTDYHTYMQRYDQDSDEGDDLNNIDRRDFAAGR